MNANQVILGGSVVDDPKVITMPSGDRRIEFRVCVNSRTKRGQKYEDKPNFFEVVFWGTHGERFEQHHKRGSICYIVGELRHATWKDKHTRESKSRVYIQARSFEFVGPYRKPDTRGRAAYDPEEQYLD